jgi:hypothetical protein
MAGVLQRIWLFVLCKCLWIFLLVVTAGEIVLQKLFGRLLRLRGQQAGRRWARRYGALDVSAGWHALLEVQRLAEQTGARVFPISGTLLGLYRNGALLPHDIDVDVGIYSDDPHFGPFIAALKAHPLLRGVKKTVFVPGVFALNPWFPPLPNDTILYNFHFADPELKGARRVTVDVFVHFRALGCDAHGGRNRLWLNSPIELDYRTIAGERLLVPRDWEKYLAENYGDFRTEKVDFESATDCPNTVNVYRPSAVIWFIHKQWLYFRAGWDQRLPILAERRRDMLRQLWRGPGSPPPWTIR